MCPACIIVVAHRKFDAAHFSKNFLPPGSRAFEIGGRTCVGAVDRVRAEYCKLLVIDFASALVIHFSQSCEDGDFSSIYSKYRIVCAQLAVSVVANRKYRCCESEVRRCPFFKEFSTAW